jgi:hypothetical protein
MARVLLNHEGHTKISANHVFEINEWGIMLNFCQSFEPCYLREASWSDLIPPLSNIGISFSKIFVAFHCEAGSVHKTLVSTNCVRATTDASLGTQWSRTKIARRSMGTAQRSRMKTAGMTETVKAVYLWSCLTI